jgi:hypothetical protein
MIDIHIATVMPMTVVVTTATAIALHSKRNEGNLGAEDRRQSTICSMSKNCSEKEALERYIWQYVATINKWWR